MEKFKSFDQLIIEYNTGPIPPPFCHRYSIEVKRLDAGDSEAALDLEYYDREELNEEDIYDEGFTPDDNFKWKGSLPDSWLNELTNKLQKTNWKKEPSAQEDGSEFLMRLKEKDQLELLQPAEVRSWQFFCQEVIQAIFELAGKEASLQIEFTDQSSIGRASTLAIEWLFSTRSVHKSSNGAASTSISWEEGQRLLQNIFGIDYYPENGLEKITDQVGIFINPGDGWWYELTPEKHSDRRTSEKISKLIATLRQLQE